MGGYAKRTGGSKFNPTKSLTPVYCRSLLTSINLLVNSDFAMDMEFKLLPKSKPYTQAEAKKMAATLGQVYMYSHQTTCGACRQDRHTTVNNLASNNPEASAELSKPPKESL